MNVDDALLQIHRIREHLDRTEVYRGWRPLPVALSGALALAGALFQPHVLAAPASGSFVAYWLLLAAAAILVGGSEIAFHYLRHATEHERRMTRLVLGQFAPCLAAGALVTAGLAPHPALLPGLWAILFGLGLFASRPFLPRAIGWVALFYLAAGGALLYLSFEGGSLEPWAMGGTFGAGQLLAAGVLYRNRERDADGG